MEFLALVFAGLVIATVMLVVLGLPLLRANPRSNEKESGERASPRARFAAMVFLGLAPLAAAAIYLRVGSPAVIAPGASRSISPGEIAALPEEERQAMIETMVAGLAARLEEQPDDPEGWRMLARSQFVLQRPADSAESYRRLLALEEGTLDDWRNFAAALAAAVAPNEFPDTPEFVAALDEIEKRAPGDRMALFYRGGAARNRGDHAVAAALWSQLLATMPADAPVRATLEQLIAEAKADAAVPE